MPEPTPPTDHQRSILASTGHNAVGRIVGDRYRLVAPVGAGASAYVYLAEDLTLGRKVAVKCLRSGFIDDHRFLRRFQAEARAAAQLSHPNLLAVYDWGQDDDTAFLVTEILLGGSLWGMIDRSPRLSLSQGLLVGLQVAEGLAYAHALGWVHRDIKPANVLFGEEGRLRIADFGIARAVAEATLTEPEGILFGTARYAAPEQADGDAADGKSDVYSLALTIIEAVTGKVPLLRGNAVGTLLLRQSTDIGDLDRLGPLGRALAPAGRADPAERPTAAELIAELTRAARDLPRPQQLALAGIPEQPDESESDDQVSDQPDQAMIDLTHPIKYRTIPRPAPLELVRPLSATGHEGLTVERPTRRSPKQSPEQPSKQPPAERFPAAADHRPSDSRQPGSESPDSESSGSRSSGSESSGSRWSGAGVFDSAVPEAPSSGPLPTAQTKTTGPRVESPAPSPSPSIAESAPSLPASPPPAPEAPDSGPVFEPFGPGTTVGFPSVAPPPPAPAPPPPPAPAPPPKPIVAEEPHSRGKPVRLRRLSDHTPMPPTSQRAQMFSSSILDHEAAVDEAKAEAEAEAAAAALVHVRAPVPVDREDSGPFLVEPTRGYETSHSSPGTPPPPPGPRPGIPHPASSQTGTPRPAIGRPGLSWPAIPWRAIPWRSFPRPAASWPPASLPTVPRPPVVLVGVGVVVLLLIAGLALSSMGSEEIPEEVAVAEPVVGNYLNGTLSEVEVAAEANDWKLEISEARQDGTSLGQILDQHPPEGRRLAVGGSIEVEVSLGPELRTVPALVGRDIGEADEILSVADLDVGAVTRRHDDQAPEGEVLAVRVDGAEPGTRLATATPVDLVVSAGPPAQPLPSFVGLTRDLVDAQAAELGLTLVETEGHSEVHPEGHVMDHVPPTGAPIRAGDELSIVFSLGPPFVTVPDVKGLAPAAAADSLAAAGFVVVDTIGPPNRPVIATDPAGGENIQKGSAIVVRTSGN